MSSLSHSTASLRQQQLQQQRKQSLLSSSVAESSNCSQGGTDSHMDMSSFLQGFGSPMIPPSYAAAASLDHSLLTMQAMPPSTDHNDDPFPSLYSQGGDPSSPAGAPPPAGGATTTRSNQDAPPLSPSGASASSIVVGVPQQRRTNVYVSSLPKTFSNHDMVTLFGVFGEIASSTVARDHTGGCKGYGFVNFTSEASAARAIANVNGMVVLQRPLNVKLADAKANPPPTPSPSPATPAASRQQVSPHRASDAFGRGLSPHQGRPLLNQPQQQVTTSSNHPQSSSQLPIPAVDAHVPPPPPPTSCGVTTSLHYGGSSDPVGGWHHHHHHQHHESQQGRHHHHQPTAFAPTPQQLQHQPHGHHPHGRPHIAGDASALPPHATPYYPSAQGGRHHHHHHSLVRSVVSIPAARYDSNTSFSTNYSSNRPAYAATYHAPNDGGAPPMHAYAPRNHHHHHHHHHCDHHQHHRQLVRVDQNQYNPHHDHYNNPVGGAFYTQQHGHQQMHHYAPHPQPIAGTPEERHVRVRTRDSQASLYVGKLP